MGLALGPFPDMYRVYQTTQTGETSILPIVSLWANSHLWWLYAYLSHNYFPLMVSVTFGEFMCICYIVLYYRYSTERAYVLKLCGMFGLGVGLVTIYVALAASGITNFQSLDQVTTTTGYIAVVVNIVLYASPLETVGKVVRTKSASSMPATLCVVTWISCLLWVLTSGISHDMFVLTPNAIGLVLSSIQVVLLFLYHHDRDHVIYDLERGDVTELTSLLGSSASKADLTKEVPLVAKAKTLAPMYAAPAVSTPVAA